MSAVQNCPITEEDVMITEKIFGPDMSSLKGKSTRRQPKPMKKDLIKIPKEICEKHRELNPCINAMHVNECGMLTAINKLAKFCSLVPVNAKQHDEHCRALDVILRQHNDAGFMTNMIHCDGECCTMMEKVKDELSVDMNHADAGNHVPEAKQNNCTIKECMRAMLHRSPCKATP